jgi:Ca2+-binding EF-hand superfamily protein
MMKMAIRKGETTMIKSSMAWGLAGLVLLMLPATTAFATQGNSYNLAAVYDINKDDLVSQEEITTKRNELHAKFDADKSGGLSEPEFAELWKSIHPAPVNGEFQALDTNADGTITLTEYVDIMKSVVAENDKNGDGFLSRADLRKEVNPMPELLKP